MIISFYAQTEQNGTERNGTERKLKEKFCPVGFLLVDVRWHHIREKAKK